MQNKIIVKTIDKNGYRNISSIKEDLIREMMKITEKNKNQTKNP